MGSKADSTLHELHGARLRGLWHAEHQERPQKGGKEGKRCLLYTSDAADE